MLEVEEIEEELEEARDAGQSVKVKLEERLQA
jgi:hypothetical protein